MILAVAVVGLLTALVGGVVGYCAGHVVGYRRCETNQKIIAEAIRKDLEAMHGDAPDENWDVQEIDAESADGFGVTD